MTEREARDWLQTTFAVPRETMTRFDIFVDYLRAEGQVQNLISAATMEVIWTRHIVDSAQLVPLAAAGDWVDLGTGAGFPGLIVAALRSEPTMLVESRRKRAEFLRHASSLFALQATTVIQARAETIAPRPFATISARAFASLEMLFAIGQRFAGSHTRWILPKGRNAQAELATAERTWQGDFRIHPSITDPDSAIIIAERVRPRTKR